MYRPRRLKHKGISKLFMVTVPLGLFLIGYNFWCYLPDQIEPWEAENLLPSLSQPIAKSSLQPMAKPESAKLSPNTIVFPSRNNLSFSWREVSEVPKDLQTFGMLTWGQPITAKTGGTILANHIEGVVQRVLDIKPNEQILVVDSELHITRWRAVRLAKTLKTELPDLVSVAGARKLYIVTCTKLRSWKTYDGNLIIEFAPA